MIILIILTFLLPIFILVVLPVGVFNLLRSWKKALMWEASLILASSVALLGYFRIDGILSPMFPIPDYFEWTLKILAVLSPACLAVAWSLWNGVKGWLSWLLFPLVPAGMIAIWLMLEFPFAS